VIIEIGGGSLRDPEVCDNMILAEAPTLGEPGSSSAVCAIDLCLSRGVSQEEV